MTDISQAQIERAIQTTATTVLRNELYFSDLDGLAGETKSFSLYIQEIGRTP